MSGGTVLNEDTKGDTLRSIKKSLMVTGGVLAIGASSLIASGAVSAQTATGSSNGPTALIQKLAQKFGLNEAEVKAVFDEERAAREIEMRQKFEDRLSAAVTDGKLTEDQKTQILTKLDELKTFRDSLSDKSEQERREAMKTKMTELKTWADENDIPMSYLRFMGHHGPRGGMGEFSPATDQE